MFNQKNHPKQNQTRFNSRKASAPQPEADLAEKSGGKMFPIAVLIMGVVSCYTTALGLEPMLDSLVLSYAMAIALSIFMMAIALQFPRAYREGMQGRFILGYSMVAIFSVLLNFNAIYGVFTAEKLLYAELKENKNHLTAIQINAEESLDRYFGALETQENLNEAMALLEEEKTNPRDYGYGDKARKLNTEVVIPLKAKLAKIKAKYDPALADIDSTVAKAQGTIEHALTVREIKAYQEAVDESIEAYSHVGEVTRSLVTDGSFTYEPLTFVHRDVGHLNHSLWTLGNLHNMESRDAASAMVSLILAILIDFIVLFVLVLLHKPSKKEEKALQELEAQEELAVEQPTETVRKSPFAKAPTTPTQETNPSTSSPIYAHRPQRNPSRPTESPKVVEQSAGGVEADETNNGNGNNDKPASWEPWEPANAKRTPNGSHRTRPNGFAFNQ